MSTGESAGVDDRRWGGRTGRERVADRRRRLLDAGVDLLVRVGVRDMTVRAVHKAAGLSSRYFYESFTDRDVYLRTLFDHVFDDIVKVVRAAMDMADTDFVSQAYASLDASVRALDGEVTGAAALLKESVAHAVLREHARVRVPAFVVDTGLAALTELPGIDEVVAEEWVRPTATAVVGATVVMHLERIDGRLMMPRAEYVDHVFRVVSGIVTGALSSRG